jgi:hypothetical protein
MLADLPAEWVVDVDAALFLTEAGSLLVPQWIVAASAMFVCSALS